MNIVIVEQAKRMVANVDLYLVGGAVVRKGTEVIVEVQFSKEWPHGGMRCVIEGHGFTGAAAYYEDKCFDKLK